jgi:uncharacterized protein YndB with AHSA1/START domain
MEAAVSSKPGAHETAEFSQPSELENQITRVFRASPERVFKLFTDPSTIWCMFSTKKEDVTVEKYEFRPGGQYSIRVPGPEGKPMRLYGEYREVDPPHRVVNTFNTSVMPDVSAVETDKFEPFGQFTRLTVRWKFARREDRDKMWGVEMEEVVNTIWDNIDRILQASKA